MKLITVIATDESKNDRAQWAEFVGNLRGSVQQHAAELVFFGGPPSWDRTASIALTFKASEGLAVANVKSFLMGARQRYSVAVLWIEGETKKI